jgi:glycosyltransferase involved in cell wall biosynthesis
MLIINSKLSSDRHAYLYVKNRFKRKDMNLVLNSTFTLVSRSTLDLRTVFEFQNKDGIKIAHAMNHAGITNVLAIPHECEFIRFGLRIKGSGEASIKKLELGSHGNKPTVIVGRSPYLILTKQYPAYDDLYKYGFLHSRVKAYKAAGLNVEIFRITSEPGFPYREFEGIDVASGNAALLDATLATGQYKKVLVHLLDSNMWNVLKKYIDHIKIIVWVHGAEIQVWQRRKYEFERMDSKEIDRQKRLSAQRVKFWNDILKNPHKNLKLIFVSKYFKNESLMDLGLETESSSYEIIHNYIDTNLFKYNKKSAEDRKSILSIRPYASRKYANDLAVDAIVKLSEKSFFNDLKFTIIGNGELFEDTVLPLRQFDNVKIIKKFLTHSQIAKEHAKHGILLVPTRMDSQGVSRDEAMSSGLVPVTTRIAAVPEFVDNKCGMLTEPESSTDLASAIEYLYNNPIKFLTLSEAASKRVRKQCGLEQTIMKEVKLIESQ